MIKTDITIIGAGLVGMTAACALAKLGLDITIIDSSDLKASRNKESDGRTSAIAAGSANFFKETGLWETMGAYAGEIRDIIVTDGKSPIFLHYDHTLVGTGPMGYIIENFYIRESLFKMCESLSSAHKGRINQLAPVDYTGVEFGDKECSVKLSTGEIITSTLIIAADGKNSNIRKIAGIRAHEWSYNQSGIVCTIAHEKHHQFAAQERFLPEGPFAVLPMQGGYHSSLVWTEKTSLVPTYLAMTPSEIEEQITLRMPEYLGKITLASRMFSYPLSLCKAKTYIGENLVLIGDAAHAMHPLAGQGFNVGIRDVVELVSLIKNHGLNESAAFLKQYEASRMADSISLIAITDILNRSFSNNILPLRMARKIGMAAVNKATPLKKFFMQHAMGVE